MPFIMEIDGETTTTPPLAASQQTPEGDYGFFRLPAELRNQIYSELIVTDCAFRLGHHGPYSHEPRQEIHPAILRTSSAVYHEAIAILYGNNSFFLGPVGFKPTYSASFLTSIGPHNALLIRTVVTHSLYPSLLTPQKLTTWFTSLGLDAPKLKIIAISFGHSPPKKSSTLLTVGSNGMVPSIPPVNFHLPTTNLPVLGSQWPLQTTVVSGPPAGVVTLLLPGTPPNVRPVVGEKDDSPEGEFERAVVKTKGWLEKRKRCDLEGLVALRNTDLRAGDDWLVYVSPAVKRRLARRW
ncbi:hypothetical protein EJ08DRAFT_732826 [Tothia fuscella]|uniref:Uncharacterized protein n=1 Tax=Tothia fuscella TaxID=1048955 RepID=A0A9P4TZW8_9PEZI|nr:hypothetical protein EJ08DRAFT_732826 [Tothia fuscella]